MNISKYETTMTNAFYELSKAILSSIDLSANKSALVSIYGSP
jgi:hypothetical protein